MKGFLKDFDFTSYRSAFVFRQKSSLTFFVCGKYSLFQIYQDEYFAQ